MPHNMPLLVWITKALQWFQRLATLNPRIGEIFWIPTHDFTTFLHSYNILVLCAWSPPHPQRMECPPKVRPTTTLGANYPAYSTIYAYLDWSFNISYIGCLWCLHVYKMVCLIHSTCSIIQWLHYVVVDVFYKWIDLTMFHSQVLIFMLTYMVVVIY